MGLFHSSAKCRLLFMLSLTTTFFMIELVVGYVTNSMALVADSFHMLSDVVEEYVRLGSRWGFGRFNKRGISLRSLFLYISRITEAFLRSRRNTSAVPHSYRWNHWFCRQYYWTSSLQRFHSFIHLFIILFVN